MDFSSLIPKEKLLLWRRHIHTNPEIAFEEFETAAYIKSQLNQYRGLTLISPTPTSVVATLSTGKPGKTIALRADIDALPVEEKTGLPFASKHSGLMHACGHDTHVAMLLGAIDVLSQIQSSLTGKVVFIFQHAEETPPGGAVDLINAGILDEVDEIYGIHIAPGLPVGSVMAKAGEFMAANDMVEIIITGKGAHGSTPEASIDPITVGAQMVTALNTIVSRNISPKEKAVVSFGQFTSGQAFNVIPHHAKILLSIRSANQSTRTLIKKRIEAIVNHSSQMFGAHTQLNYTIGYNPVINHEEAFQKVKNACQALRYSFIPAQSIMGSEDFSYYLQKVPGCFYTIGGGALEDGFTHMGHHPQFDIDERALEVGCKMHVQLILDALE